MGQKFSTITLPKDQRANYRYDCKIEDYIVAGDYDKISKMLKEKNTYGWTMNMVLEVSRLRRADMVGKKFKGVPVTTFWDNIYLVQQTSSSTRSRGKFPTQQIKTDAPPPYSKYDVMQKV